MNTNLKIEDLIVEISDPIGPYRLLTESEYYEVRLNNGSKKLFREFFSIWDKLTFTERKTKMPGELCMIFLKLGAKSSRSEIMDILNKTLNYTAHLKGESTWWNIEQAKDFRGLIFFKLEYSAFDY